jgi:MazG family protein
MTGSDAAGNGRWDKVRDLWKIVARLRGESGCPWDRKQTPESVQTYLVEEAHEGAAAVRAGKPQDVAEELGDLLFMVFFLVYLYEERGDFSLDEVCDRITEKMVRRHPHVFGTVQVDSAEEVKDNWEKIKAAEKADSGRKPDAVPESLPALMRAYRIISRLAHADNGKWNDAADRARELARKSRALEKGISDGTPVAPELIGELLVEVVNLARIKGLRAEDCLHEHLRTIELLP